MARRSAPEVNAGSMADIAFLLLIFFLVSTTIQTDYGIQRRLPPPPDIQEPEVVIKEKNLFRVDLNQMDQLFVENERMDIHNLRQAVLSFLDNGGGNDDLACIYCKGNRDISSSDNPLKAVISLSNNRETSYDAYIKVQNEIVAAYTALRNREGKRLYGKTFSQLEKELDDVNYSGNKDVIKAQIRNLQSLFPEKISEAELNE